MSLQVSKSGSFSSICEHKHGQRPMVNTQRAVSELSDKGISPNLDKQATTLKKKIANYGCDQGYSPVVAILT